MSTDTQKILDEIKEYIGSSHSAVAKVQSNQYSDILVKLEEVKGEIKGMQRRQDITNGRIAKNEESIITLQTKATLFDVHVSSENQKDKKNDDDVVYWRRSLYWWAFIVVSGAILYTMRKVFNL